MSESNFWADFVRWYAYKLDADRCWHLKQAADMVTTRNEAVVAIISCGGISDVYEMRSRWLAETGRVPPAEPASRIADLEEELEEAREVLDSCANDRVSGSEDEATMGIGRRIRVTVERLLASRTPPAEARSVDVPPGGGKEALMRLANHLTKAAELAIKREDVGPFDRGLSTGLRDAASIARARAEEL